MFVSRGRTIEIIDAFKKNLLEVILSYIGREGYYRILYRDPDGNTYTVFLGDKTIIACNYIDNIGNVIVGDRCWNELVKKGVLLKDVGVIEVVELTKNQIMYDLEAIHGQRLTNPIEPMSLGDIIRMETVSSDLDRVISIKYTIVDEELDPLYLTRLIMGSEFVGSYKCSLRELDKVINEMSLKHPDKTVYIIVRNRDVEARMIIDNRAKSIKVFALMGKEAYYGKEALSRLLSYNVPVSVHIFIYKRK